MIKIITSATASPASSENVDTKRILGDYAMKTGHSLGPKARIFAGVSILALSAAMSVQPAAAQSSNSNVGTNSNVESVEVTGTSIRGVAPVGSNLITVGSDEIKNTNAQTMWQVFKDIPSISNLGQAPQGNSGGNSFNVPTIHNVGSSSSNSTLILIDGHRFAPSTIKQAMMDTGILPTNMVERVEVLPDGASATYGADAVAGVINVITRKHFDGFDITGSAGFGSDYHTMNASVLYGDHWGKSSLILAASYAYGSPIAASARSYIANQNYIPLGGSNFNNFSCDPAVLQPTGSSVYYLSAAATSSYPTAQSGAPCNTSAYTDFIPSEQRVNGMMRFETEVTNNLVFSTDFVVGNRTFVNRRARGSLQTVVFGTGAQANPFYTNPPGYTGTATSQTVRWDSSALLGPGTQAKDTSIGFNAHSALMGVYGWNYSAQSTIGALCSSCANLALNGTAQSSGSTTTSDIAGTNTIVLNLPLTTSNALDVWNPAATNRTSAAVRQLLTQNDTITPFINDIQQYRASIDGKLLTLPGGDVNVAVGAEYQHWAEHADFVTSTNIGPSISGAGYLHLPLQRDVKALYGEMLIPIIGPEMSVPLINKFSIDVAGRYDDYSDFGSTSNPKVGADWEVVDGFKLRGSWATSFVAPQIIQVGTPARNNQGVATYGLDSETMTVSTVNFPSVLGIPGCNAAFAATHSGNCVITGATPGISYQGNQVPLTPATGKTWSLGFDARPAIIPGLSFSATLFNNAMSNMLTATNSAQALAAPSTDLIHFYPNGLTQAQLNSEIPAFFLPSGSIPAPSQLYYVLNGNVKNFLFLDIQGVDASINYDYATDKYGDFSFGGNVTQFTIFKQHSKGTTYKFSVLGAVGANGTFAAIPTQARFHIGWNYENFDARVYANFTGGYRNTYATSIKPVVNANGVLSGGDVIHSNTTFDLHVNYTLSPGDPLGSSLAGSDIYLDVQNVFDKNPIFFNAVNGYSSFSGNPIGRVVTAGVRVHL
jgi:iron complex outermembrane receptor protein